MSIPKIKKMKINSLKRNKILKSKKQIDDLFVSGNSIGIFPIRLIYNIDNELDSNFLTAFSVSKKKFKRAVDRNRIKRLMRESFRLQQKNIPTKKGLIMMWIYTGKKLPVYDEIYQTFEKIIDELKQKIDG